MTFVEGLKYGEAGMGMDSVGIRTLYVSDLDGTLLDRNARLAEGCRGGLRELLEGGLEFTVASARSVFSIRQILGDLPLKLPVVSFNGAFISDLTTGGHEVVNAIDRSIAGEIFDALPRFGCVPFISTFDGREDRVYYDRVINDGMRWYLEDRFQKKDRRWRKVRDMRSRLREQLVCITLIARQEELKDLHQHLSERYPESVEMHFQENMYSPGWHWLTIHDCRATKARGIDTLRTVRNLHDHRLIVFGDHLNDLKMFQAADYAIAVSNAVEELRNHAHEIIGAHDEGSVVRYLKKKIGREKN